MLSKRINRLFLTFLYFLNLLNCDAQLQKGYYFHNYDEKNSLIAKYNTFFFTDSKGFLWISSTEGLNRFDGLNAKTYLHNPLDSTSLYDNNIQSPFFEDKKGNLWFCTAEAIHCYNREKDCFQRFWIIENGKRLESDYYTFALDKQGFLWFRSGSWSAHPKLYRVDINKVEGSILPAQFVCDFAGYRSKIISHNENNTAVLTYPSVSGYGIVEYTIDNVGKCIRSQTYLSGKNLDKYKIKSIVVDKNSTIWLTTDRGLVSYDRKNNRVQLFDLYKSEIIDNTLGLAAWKESILIISTRNKGVLFFDKIKKVFYEQLKNEELKGLADGLCSSVFEQIYVDSINNLWLSSSQNSCLNHINLDKIKFSNIRLANGLSKDFSTVLEDNLQNIWVSYNDMGIFVFNNKGEIIKSFEEKLFFDKKIRHLLKDKEGRIWIQTDHQLLKSEKGTYTLQSVYLSEDAYLYNVEQLNDGKIVLLTEKGVFQFKRNQLEPFQELTLKYQSLKYNSIFQDKKDNLFLVEKDNFVRVFNLKNDSILRSDLQIKGDIVYFFQQNDTIWAASEKGLWKIYEAPNKIFQYNFVLELPYLYKVIVDKNGIFWLSSDSGLYTFNPQNKQLHKYNASDGLKGNIFTRFCALSNGDIWLAAFSKKEVLSTSKFVKFVFNS
jgi:ligand-binding sensor domain-containing protein